MGIHNIHIHRVDSALRIVYGEHNFQELLKKDNPANIHLKKLGFPAIKICQLEIGLSQFEHFTTKSSTESSIYLENSKSILWRLGNQNLEIH